MGFDIPSLDELTELINDDHRNQLPEDDVSRYSDNFKRNRVTAGAVTSLHAHLSNVDRDSLITTAASDALAEHGAIFGITRKSATGASGSDALLVRGIDGASWSTTDALEHVSGITYYPNSSGTLSGTEALIGVTAATGGADTNLDEGETLTWSETPDGLEDDAELQSDLAGGLDQESEGAWRERILNRAAQGSKGGTLNDWQQWALAAISSIDAVYVYPNRNGLGSVDVACLKSGTGSARLLTSDERADVLEYLESVSPITARARVLEVVEQSTDVAATVRPILDASLNRDWDDSTPGNVGAWDSATSTLTFGARPSTIQIGSRLVIAGTVGKQVTVESLSGTDGVVLSGADGLGIAINQLVYSGGPLIESVRDIIQDLFDSLGPRIGSFGAADWVASIFESRLFSSIQTVSGVLDSTIIAPSGDTTPDASDYPNDGQVNVLVAGNIFVRYE